MNLTQSASELVQQLKNKNISAVELLEAHLDRIAKVNPDINAVVTLDKDRTRKRAIAADEALENGADWGPLHGLPMTVKDAYEVEGIVSTGGSPKWKDHVPNRNAEVVERLTAAGANVFGKTNVPNLSGDWQTYNEIFGVTNNPWDQTKTPGGSSGGSAAAVAAGLTPLEVGSDIGGSIRIPAHFCGIYGHKPSYDLIPMRGHLPPPPGSLSENDTITVAGPLARNAADLEIALSVLAGPRTSERKGWQLNLPSARHQQLKDFRIALWPDDGFCPVETAMADAIQETADQLAKQGAAVTEENPGFSLEMNNDLFWNLFNAIIATGYPQPVLDDMQQLLKNSALDDKDPRVRQSRGALIGHKDWLKVNELRLRIKAMWDEFFQSYDVLLCPVTFTTAFAHDHNPDLLGRYITVDGEKRHYSEITVWPSLATISHLPATVIPIGQNSAGLPTGVQVIGPYLEDYTTIAFARAIEGVCSGYTPPPTVQ
jgi:amidase